MKILKYFYLVILILLVSTPIYSQCLQEEIDKTEYIWKKDADALTDRPGPANLPKEQAIVKKIADIAEGFYPRPKGGEIEWYGYYSGQLIQGQYSKGYQLDILFSRYQCTNGKVKLIAYNSSIYVAVNALTFFGNEFDMNGKTWTTVHAAFHAVDGYTYFNFNRNDRYNTEESWLITYNGKLPFSLVSRKEYVTEARADQMKAKDKKAAELKKSYGIKSQAEQDAARQRYVEGLKKSYKGDELTKRIEKYDLEKKADQGRYEEAVKFNDEHYKKIIGKYDEFLASHDEAYMSQPAIVKPYTREVFDGFDNNIDEVNSVYLVKNNPSYYNSGLPVTAPQYITVLARHPKKGDTDAMFYDGIAKKEFLDSLAALLGKQ